jgi:hypothetical protein
MSLGKFRRERLEPSRGWQCPARRGDEFPGAAHLPIGGRFDVISYSLRSGVTVARLTLNQLVKVQILAPQLQ